MVELKQILFKGEIKKVILCQPKTFWDSPRCFELLWNICLFQYWIVLFNLFYVSFSPFLNKNGLKWIVLLQICPNKMFQNIWNKFHFNIKIEHFNILKGFSHPFSRPNISWNPVHIHKYFQSWWNCFSENLLIIQFYLQYYSNYIL